MLFQISEAEPKPQRPAYTQDDDLGFKMSPFEQCWPVPVHKPQAYQAPSPALQHCRLSDLLPFARKPGRVAQYSSLGPRVVKKLMRPRGGNTSGGRPVAPGSA